MKNERANARFYCFLVTAVLCLASVTSADLVSYWNFDDASGDTAIDSASGFNGTVSGAAWAQGKIGGALNFDGSDYVDIAYTSELDIDAQNGITVAAWVKATGYPDYNPTTRPHGPIFGLFSNSDNTNGSKNFLTFSNLGNGYKFAWDQFKPKSGWLESITPNLNQWYHVAAVQNSNFRGIYINGVLVASDNNPEIYSSGSPSKIRIGGGALGWAPCGFEGLIDEVMVFDNDLSASEIQALVPEPATVLLIGFGALLLRRKK